MLVRFVLLVLRDYRNRFFRNFLVLCGRGVKILYREPGELKLFVLQKTGAYLLRTGAGRLVKVLSDE